MDIGIQRSYLLLFFVVNVFSLSIAGNYGINEGFRTCLHSTKALLSFPSNTTWWYDSQGIHVPVLRHPIAVAYAASTFQVTLLVRCAIKYHIRPVPRSGGHSYEGFSSQDNQLVIDLSHINYVKVNPKLQTAYVGGGVRLGKVYYELSKFRFTFPAGDCPTVGLSGHIASGGLGYLVRKYGLAADSVLELEFVDWRGKVLTANRMSNKELYWVLRGGGGGNFGIITRMKLKLHPFPKLTTGFVLTWNEPFQSSSVLGKCFFEWKPWDTVTEDLTLTLLIGQQSRLFGIYVGNDGVDGLKRILNSSGFLRIGGKPMFKYYNSKNFFEVQAWQLNGFRHYGNEKDYMPYNTGPFVLKSLDLPPFPNRVFETLLPIQNDTRVNATHTESMWTTGPIPGLKPHLTGHVFDKYSSQLFTKVLDEDAYSALDRFVELGGLTHWKPLGGFMSNVSKDFNAFPHRRILFDAQHFAIYNTSEHGNLQTFAEEKALIRYLITSLESFTDHGSYQGYPDLMWGTDPRLYMPRYYGNHVKRLIQAKRSYDPHDFFHNEQSIPLFFV